MTPVTRSGKLLGCAVLAAGVLAAVPAQADPPPDPVSGLVGQVLGHGKDGGQHQRARRELGHTHADDGIPTISVQHLPPEARTTIGLIRSGGPFPYRQDGVVFQNREHLLPREPTGYYHEYTVETPGSPDRGARRIIRARDGTMYYTADHYDSFQRVVS